MPSKKGVFISILFAVSISTVVSMNLDLGESTKSIGRVITLEHLYFPVESTKIVYGAMETRLSLSLSGNLESIFEVGKCYTISTVKRPFQFFPRVTEYDEIEPEERTIKVTGSGYRHSLAPDEWTTKIHERGGTGWVLDDGLWRQPSWMIDGSTTYSFRGKYFDAFEKGKTYRIIFVGEVLLDFSEIT